MKNYETIEHPFEPIFDENSKILILGSMPSEQSRKANIYYGNPKNRFWKILSIILNVPFPKTNQDKINLIKEHNIALWDVLKSCDIRGASDSSIKFPVVNDFSIITNKAKIQAIFTLGKTATNLYKKHTGQNSIYLPSTSPANCVISESLLIKEFSQILNYIN